MSQLSGQKRPAPIPPIPVAIPEVPKKKRKSKKNTILLSRTATAVLKATPLTRAESSMVGQFVGSDIGFWKVGSRFVEGTENIYHVEGEKPERRESIRCSNVPDFSVGFYGKRFGVFEVERRTASRIRVKQLYTVIAYPALWHKYSPSDLLGVFRWTHEDCKSITHLPHADHVKDAAELDMLKDTYEVRDVDVRKEVKYKKTDKRFDYDGELVLEDGEYRFS
jgi:hypothetical protein